MKEYSRKVIVKARPMKWSEFTRTEIEEEIDEEGYVYIEEEDPLQHLNWEYKGVFEGIYKEEENG